MSDKPNVRIWFSEQKRLESSAEGRQIWFRRNLRWQEVPHLGASNQKCSAANSGTVNRRLNDAVAAGRATLKGHRYGCPVHSVDGKFGLECGGLFPFKTSVEKWTAIWETAVSCQYGVEKPAHKVLPSQEPNYCQMGSASHVREKVGKIQFFLEGGL